MYHSSKAHMISQETEKYIGDGLCAGGIVYLLAIEVQL